MVDLVYARSLPGGKKAGGRVDPPVVYNIDWNENPEACGRAKKVLALATSEGTRVYQIENRLLPLDDCSLICNRKAPRGRKCLVCKWSNHDGGLLATGGSSRPLDSEESLKNEGATGTGGIIRLLKYRDGHFYDAATLKVHDGEDVSQLSWDREGKYLLVVVNKKGQGKLNAKLYVISHATSKRISVRRVIQHPQSNSRGISLTAMFHPVDSMFISVAGSELWIWTLDKYDFEWKSTHVDLECGIGRYSNPPLVCFDKHGERLAACGSDDRLRVWQFLQNGRQRYSIQYNHLNT